MSEAVLMTDPPNTARAIEQAEAKRQETLSADLLDRVQKLAAGEGDILVFHAPHELHTEARVNAKNLCRAVQAHTKALVLMLEPGWTIEKLGPDHLEALGLQRITRPLVSSRGPVTG